MAIGTPTSLGKGGADSAGTSVAFNTTAAVAAGDFITLFVTWIGGTITLSSVSGGGLTWVIDGQGGSGNNFGEAIVSAHAPSGLATNTTITATYSASVAGARFIAADSWPGVATSNPVDGTPPAQHTDTSPNWVSNSYTITDPGSIIIGLGMETDNLFTSTPASTTPPTIELQDFGIGGSGAAAAYRQPGATGSYTVGGTWSGTTTGGGTIAVAYKPAPVNPADNTTKPGMIGEFDPLLRIG